MEVVVRQTRKQDFRQIIELSKVVYREKSAWTERELASHLEVFPQGQFVAHEKDSDRIIGMSASLIVLWDDYEIEENWVDFTCDGMFTNHDPENGKTLYGAEIMVSPKARKMGIGEKLYRARRRLVHDLDLIRIRAGARLRNYHLYAEKYSAKEYVDQIIKGKIKDPTLTFQIKQGFNVIAVISGYLDDDRESLGKAAIIEWKNHSKS